MPRRSETSTHSNEHKMALQLYRPPLELDQIPPEVRLMIYSELFHDSDPISRTNNETPIQLQTLMSLRQTCKLVAPELEFTKLSELKSAYYTDNTILFDNSQEVVDFAVHKPRSVLNNVRSIFIDG